MKMTKVERLLLALAVCGTLAVGAHAAEEVIYEDDYATVTATTEEKTITYTDGEGVEHTYTYTVTSDPTVTIDVSGLVYESPNGGSNEKYYKWEDGTLVSADSAEEADVTAKYGDTSDRVSITSGDKGDYTTDFVGLAGSSSNYGGAFSAYTESGTTTVGDLTGNFIGNYQSKSGTSYGGAVANYTQTGTVTLGDIAGNFIGNYVNITSSGTAFGGAIANLASGSGGKATIGDITGKFVGNYAHSDGSNGEGGAIANIVRSTGTATIGNIAGDFIGNYVNAASGAYGGAISNHVSSSGTVTIDGDITGNFINNYTVTSGTSNLSMGGAISNYVSTANGTAIIGNIKGDFIGNHTEGGRGRGGAIANDVDALNNTATISSIEGNFIGNYTTSSSSYVSGGAIYNYANANVTNASAEIGSIKGNFIGNYATTTTSSGGNAYGGAIYNQGGTDGTTTATINAIEANFIGNYVTTTAEGSSASGGAINNFNATIKSIADSSFVSNSAGDDGGAIDNRAGGVIESITGTSFVENVAGGNGGAINNLGTITTISADFIANVAGGSGGAIYNEGEIGTIAGSFIGNVAGEDGGAIYNAGTITTVSAAFSGNTSGSSGVSIYNVGTIGEISGSSFTGNTVEAESGEAKGGAIYNGEGGKISAITGGSFSGNGVVASEGEAKGGALYNAGSIEDFEIGDLTGNYAVGSTGAKGGAIYDENSTDVTIGGDVVNNYAKVTGEGDVTGGVIYLKQAEEAETSVTVKGNIIGNHAETANGKAYGGAFYNNEYGTLTIGGTIIGGDEEDDANYVSAAGKGNVAFGGAIYNAGSLILSDGVEFSRNWAYSSDGTAAGGAIYNADTGTISGSKGDLTLGSLTGNYALGYGGEAAGGAIYNENKDVAISVSGDITGNSASAGAGDAKGGAIFTIGDVTVEGDEISDNHAFATDDALGGAIYSEGTLIVDVASITDNDAASEFGDAKGGAIYSDGVLYINYDAESIPDLTGNCAASENGKAYGGAIYNINTETGEGGTLSLGDLTDNQAAGGTGAYGGAIYDEISTQIDVYGDVTGNSAVAESGDALGGAIYNTQGTLSVYGDIGGGTDEDEYNYVMAAGKAKGGAIYTEGILTVDATSITDNYAIGVSEASGGAIYVINGDSDAGTSITVTDEVSGNVAYATEGDAKGGVIYSDGILNLNDDSESCPEFANNYAQSVSGEASGGAIYNINTETGEGGTLALGDLTENGAIGATGAKGGAIYDEVSTQIDVLGSMTGNYATTDSGYAKGGAIYLDTTDEVSVNVWDDVTGNHATTGDGSAMGGAIYNNEQGTVTVYGDIGGTGTGENNFVIATEEAKGGAVYNEGTLVIESSEEGSDPNIGGNAALADKGDAMGGAIYNEGELTVSAGSIENNYATTTDGVAYGGAIYTEGDLTLTATSITNNHAISENGDAAGGAILIGADITGSITVSGDVSGNTAESGGGDAGGGAIANDYTGTTISISGNLTDNGAKTTADDGDVLGGAIYSLGDVTVKNGEISGNTAESKGDTSGGAIYTEGTLVVDVKSITGNYALGVTEASGGAISLADDGTDSSIAVSGAVSGNVAYATGDGDAMGGAIYSETILTVSAGSLEGNYAVSEKGNAGGGAILINDEGAGSSITVSGDVTDNHAIAENGVAQGGAIYAASAVSDDAGDTDPYSVSTYSATDGITEVIISGDVSGNTAKGSTAQGGAIYNEGGTVTLSGNIVGNSVEGDDANGGAIYNDGGTVNIIIENDDVAISGNTANDESNFLYATEDSVTNFILTDASLTVEDGIAGETGYEVNVEGNGIDNTTFYMFKSFDDANFSIGNTTLNTVDGEATKYEVNQLTLTGDINMVADVDTENKEMDRFVTNDNTYDINGTLNVSGLNAASDTKEKNIAVYFAETNLMDSVTSSVSTFGSVINQYEAFYVTKEDDGIHYDGEVYDISEEGSSSIFSASDENGGYFVINRTGRNPAIMVTPMGQMGLFNAMNLSFGYAFEHSDYFMKLPSKTRLAITEETKSKRSKKAPKETDATKAAYYNQHELTHRGAWVKTYASNDNVSYKHGWESRDKYYGALVGFDTNLRESANGWASVFSGYIGTLGIRQEYDAGHIKQHGGLIGVTESFYKKNFYSAWTAAAGRMRVHEHTELGHDASTNDTWGIAAKFGWNIELAGGKYSLLPTFAATYTTVNPENYTNSADVYMSGSGVRAVQLNPNLKFIMNMENGLQPYLTVGEVWTVGQSSSVKADGEKLDELELKPYTEYGLGIQKRWANERDAYIQVLGHSGGSEGILINAGIRWNF